MKKRIPALFLFAAILTALLASCGDKTTSPTDQTDTTDGGTGSAETEAVTEAFSDGLPDADYDGRAFRVAVGIDSAFEFEAESLNGNVENDAVYERNTRIEERFNIDIQPIVYAFSVADNYDTLARAVMADEDICDLAGFEVWNFYRATTKEIYQDWRDTKYIQFDKPWWNQEINDNATFNQKLLGLTGTLALTYMQNTCAIFFNSTLLGNYDIDMNELYQMVKDGKWTLDALNKTVTDIYEDLNGNGKRDDDDRYGYGGGDWCGLDVWPTAFEIPITSKASDGSLTVEIAGEKTYTALERVYDLLYNNVGAHWADELASDHARTFVNNQYVLYQTYLLSAFTTFRDMTDPYGVLPQPKMDEAQENYHNLVIDGYTIWGLPVTVQDTDFVSMITEALCADTYHNVYPVYYDIAMKSKYTQDPDTAAMVDIIVGNASFDVAFMYGVYLDNLPYLFRDCLIAKSTDFASKYAKVEKSIRSKLDSVYELYK